MQLNIACFRRLERLARVLGPLVQTRLQATTGFSTLLKLLAAFYKLLAAAVGLNLAPKGAGKCPHPRFQSQTPLGWGSCFTNMCSLSVAAASLHLVPISAQGCIAVAELHQAGSQRVLVQAPGNHHVDKLHLSNYVLATCAPPVTLSW